MSQNDSWKYCCDIEEVTGILLTFIYFFQIPNLQWIGIGLRNS